MRVMTALGVFFDLLTPKLPMEGAFCPACGLLQDRETENGALCNAQLYRAIQYKSHGRMQSARDPVVES